MRKAVRREIDETAAAQIHSEGQACAMCNIRDFRFGDRRSEALNDVVARVHLHEEGGTWRDRLGVVAWMGAIGGTYFDHLRARALHDVGHTERAADLDQLAARDD